MTPFLKSQIYYSKDMAEGNKPAKLKLKKVLKNYKITQYELSKRLDVPTNYVTKIVKPNFNPTLKTLKKLAKAIGCKVSDLIDD